MDRMLADLARMEQMVTQILESARLERGRVDLKSEPLQLAGAVARVVAHLEERARQEQISISSDIAPSLTLVSDPLALDVVVRNVLENALAAVKGTAGGRITLTARATDGEVELLVRDSGVGFEPAEGRRLFQKFSRLRSGAGYYGTGLGLYIVRRLMELAHGRVSAHSDGVGQGASVRLTWPAASAAALTPPATGQELRP
jgi:signal transduction histidine kinase